MSGVASYVVFFLIQALIFAVVCLGLNLQWDFRPRGLVGEEATVSRAARVEAPGGSSRSGASLPPGR